MKTKCLILNEDNSHFFMTRTEKDMTHDGLYALVDQYVDTQVLQIVFNPNSQRTSYCSSIWDNIWEHGQQDQPVDNNGTNWVKNAELLYKRGLNPYSIWLRRCREKGISPWISMRMNDVHSASDSKSYLHSSFWINHPELWRANRIYSEWTDVALDYGRMEVREYSLKLIREYFELYDFDGLELDWMRFPFHFKPGFEEQGNRILTDFLREVRKLSDVYSEHRGHPIKIRVRVPSRPQTASGLGLDPIPWATEGLIDQVVITPFFMTIEFDMPVEEWTRLLRGTSTELIAGLELCLRPTPEVFPKYGANMPNSAETVFGAATSLLYRGVDQIYLFNYMDFQTTVDNPSDYSRILHQAGTLSTASSGIRRHVITYHDLWAQGEPQAYSLPVLARQDRLWEKPAEFKINIGPAPQKGMAYAFIGLGEDGNMDTSSLDVYVNTVRCSLSVAASPKPIHPIVQKVAGFDIPVELLHNGSNYLKIVNLNEQLKQIVWVEIWISNNKAVSIE